MADKGRLKIQCFVGDTYVPVDGSNITSINFRSKQMIIKRLTWLLIHQENHKLLN